MITLSIRRRQHVLRFKGTKVSTSWPWIMEFQKHRNLQLSIILKHKRETIGLQAPSPSPFCLVGTSVWLPRVWFWMNAVFDPPPPPPQLDEWFWKGIYIERGEKGWGRVREEKYSFNQKASCFYGIPLAHSKIRLNLQNSFDAQLFRNRTIINLQENETALFPGFPPDTNMPERTRVCWEMIYSTKMFW